MDQADGGGVEPVRQVGEEGLQLAGGQHALVDDGAGGERREVHAGLTLGALAHDEGDAVQLDAGKVTLTCGRGQEDLAEARHDRAGGGTQQVRGDRDVAPAEDGEVLVGGDGLDLRDRGGVGGVLVGEEGDADRVRAGGGELEGDLGAQERVGDLGQDARAVTGVRLGTGRTAVLQVAQDGERLLDDLVVGDARQRRDEADATGVVLVPRVVQALSSRSRIRNERVRRARCAGLGLVVGVHGCRQHRLSRRRLGIGGPPDEGLGGSVQQGRRWPSAISCRLHDARHPGKWTAASTWRTQFPGQGLLLMSKAGRGS